MIKLRDLPKFFIIVNILLKITPCFSIIYFESDDLGCRLCDRISKNLRTCPTPSVLDDQHQEITAEEYARHRFPNITSPRIFIQARRGSQFNVRHHNTTIIYNARAFVMMAEGTQVDIELLNDSTDYQFSCYSSRTLLNVSSSIMSVNNLLYMKILHNGYPDLSTQSAFTIDTNWELQSGHLTCRSMQVPTSAEVFQVFTQPTFANDTTPFVPVLEMNVQSDKSKTNAFIVPCRTNHRLESTPDLLEDRRPGNLTALTLDDINGFTWDPRVGFQFNGSVSRTGAPYRLRMHRNRFYHPGGKVWELKSLVCRFGSFLSKTFYPSATIFRGSFVVDIEDNQLFCRFGRDDSIDYLLGIEEARFHICLSDVECELDWESGTLEIERRYRKSFATPNQRQSALLPHGIFSCTAHFNYLYSQVPDITYSKFFVGIDSSLYLLPGSYPNSSVIQISVENGPFYKSHTDLYHEFTCVIIDFVLSGRLYFVVRHEDMTERMYQRDSHSGFLTPASKHVFNISLHTNMTHAKCISLTNEGKVVSAERSLKILDASPPYLTAATTNSRVFKLDEVNENLALTCPIIGAPPPEYRWAFDEKLSNLVQGSSGRDLIFRQLHKSMAGKYLCEAWNPFGNLSFEYHVDVEDFSGTIGSTTIAWIAFGVCFCVLLFCASVIFAYKYFKAQRQIRNLTPGEALEFLEGVAQSGEAPCQDGSELALRSPFTKLIQSKDLIIAHDAVLGKGQYGIVYRGILRGEVVAVKTFKRSVTYDEFRACLIEVKLLEFLGEHRNIVKFIGADVTNIQKREIYVIMELSPIGSLEKHLRMLQPSASVNTEWSQYSGIDEGLTCLTLFGFCEQIAVAMEYIESRKVIHGDLAARNVLVYNHGVVKVTDFGYSRQLYDNSMYKANKNRALPWRWASIELLRQMEFSTESDIWAFGVTTWEIFSFGNIPFPSEKWNNQFMESLDNGLRLEKPTGLSESQYSFLQECWNKEKSARPKFSSLKLFFSQEKENLRHLLDRTRDQQRFS